MIDDKSLTKLIHMDAGLMAEQITGKSYKESEETANLFCGLHMLISDVRRRAFSECDDTYYGISFGEFERIAKGEGFKEIGRLEIKRFKYGVSNTVERIDTRIFMYCSEGLYLTFDSYGKGKKKPTVNSADLYYSVRLKDDLAQAFLDSMDILDEWERNTPNWSRKDRPQLIASWQQELFSLFLSVCGGNAAINWEERAYYRLASGKQIREGLRLFLSQLRKQTCWEILSQLKAWEWSCQPYFGELPVVGHEKQIGTVRNWKDVYMSKEDWSELQFALFPPEHQYLRNIMSREELNNYHERREEFYEYGQG